MTDHPSSFFILENEKLGNFWVGMMKLNLNEWGRPILPSVCRNKLIDNLESKYSSYSNPYLNIVSLNNKSTFYGLETWLSKLECEIKRQPQKYEKLERLLTAGWNESDLNPHSTINVLHVSAKSNPKEVYKKLVKEWEDKGMLCLNTYKFKTRTERYEDSKNDPNFLHNQARNKIISRMKKTGKLPKQSTLEKYGITFSLTQQPSQPCSSSLESDCNQSYS